MSSAIEDPATTPGTPASDSPTSGIPIPAADGDAEHVGPDATAADARAIAEAARETSWTQPSFAKGLYLGSFDLSLIHPWPEAPADDVERGEAFMARLADYCRTMSGRTIERDDRIPDDYLKGLAELGVFGMKIPREYGGLGLTLVYYGRALALLGSVHPSLGALLSAHQSIGVPEPVKVFGTPAQKQRIPAPLRRRRRHRFPADRARRRQRPGPDGQHGRPLRRRRVLPPGRRQALDHQRRDRRTRRGHGPRAAHTDADGPPTKAASAPSWSRWTPPASPWKTATPSWGCAGSKTASPASTRSGSPRPTGWAARARA